MKQKDMSGQVWPLISYRGRPRVSPAHFRWIRVHPVKFWSVCFWILRVFICFLKGFPGYWEFPHVFPSLSVTQWGKEWKSGISISHTVHYPPTGNSKWNASLIADYCKRTGVEKRCVPYWLHQAGLLNKCGGMTYAVWLIKAMRQSRIFEVLYFLSLPHIKTVRQQHASMETICSTRTELGSGIPRLKSDLKKKTSHHCLDP